MKSLFALVFVLFLSNVIFSQQIKDSLIDCQITVMINETKLNMMLDTGATASLIGNTSKIGGVSFYQDLPKDTRKVQQFSTKTKQDFYTVPRIKSAIGEVENLSVLINENFNVLNCKKDSANDGIIGMDFLRKISGDSLISLNFQNKKIELTNHQFSTDFKELDSKFEGGLIYLNLLIEGKKYKTLLDTGAEGVYLILTKGKFSKDEYPYKEIESPMAGATGEIVIKKTVYFRNIPIEMSPFTTNETVISVDQNSFSNILGREFIKNFNWLIDFKNKKIYAQQHSKDFDNSWLDKLNDINELAVAVNKELLVIYSKSGLRIGSIIKSINGIEINDENLCEYQNLLLKNNVDWSAFDIKLQ